MDGQLILQILKTTTEQSKIYRSSPAVSPQVKTFFINIESKIAEAIGLIDETSSTDSPLTPKEFEVLSLVAKGFTNKEVASALEVSHKTIEFHLSKIMQKTESSKRTEAVTNAISKGWIAA